MQNKSLLSIAHFCDNGYNAIFTKHSLLLQHNIFQKIFQSTTTGMWLIDLHAEAIQPVPTSNHVEESFRHTNSAETNAQNN